MSLFNDFMSLIYPRLCEACDEVLIEKEKFLCLKCLVDLPKSKSSLSSGHELFDLFKGRVPLDQGYYLYSFEKNARVQKLLHAIKYQGQKQLAVYLGELLAKEIDKGEYDNFDCIIPIPLHENKFKIRGFNQSLSFAEGLSSVLTIPIISESLIRTNPSFTQTRKRKYERWENVEGVFKLKDEGTLKNKHVLLVDDVITTGATIEAAWQTLGHIDGIRISLASIAFAKKD
jgi:competence protein ComFC